MVQATTTDRRTQEERKALSESRMLRAARELFAQQGYMRTTLSEVGKAAGYTGGLVSHRFGSKEGLLKAVIQHIATRFFSDQLKPHVSVQSAEESITNYIDVYLSEIGKRESTMRALYVIMGEALGSVPEAREEIALMNRAFRKRLVDIIERGMKSGEFRKDVQPNAAAILITALLRGVTMQILTDKKAFKVKDIIPLVQRQVLFALK